MGDVSACAGSLKSFVEVALELVIREVSCLVSAPDQVLTGLGLRVEMVHEFP